MCGARGVCCHTLQKAGARRWHCDIGRYWEGGCVLGVLGEIAWGFVCRDFGLEFSRNAE